MTLPRSTPFEHGIDPAGIGQFLDAIADGGIELHSMMLLRHGNVVAEGWWAPYGPSRVHLLYSLSKTFTSTAIGLAVQEGRLSVDDKVVSFFPEAVPAEPSPHLLDMRVHHLLCMGTGHIEDTTRQVFNTDTADPMKTFFAHAPEQAPGSVFTYNSTATYVLSAIITALTGESLTEYLRPRLFEPLGIDQALWQSRDGIDMGFSGLHITTESIAKLGQLYLQRGRWGERQLIPESWVSTATQWQIDTVTPWRQDEQIDWQQGYGYQFWRSQHNAFRGDGAHGQFCVVLPDSDVVLATTAATGNMQAILDAAWNYLLPAIDSANGSDTADVAVRQRLGGLELPTVSGSDTGPDAGPWSFTTDQQEETLGITALTVTPTAAGWSIQLGDQAQIGCGHGVWTETAVTTGGSVVVPVAASAAWSDAGTFEADIIFPETPHRVRISCTPGGGTFTMTWNMPRLNAGGLERLAAPRPGTPA